MQTTKDKESFLLSLKKLDSEENNYGKIISLLNNEEKQTFVVVIGESENRIHNSLYGYNRNTFPMLSSIKNNLYVFSDVIAPHIYTNAVLQKILTFSGYYLEATTYSTKNIINFFKTAGFKTYWLSNQYYIGEYDSAYSAITFHADKTVYLNQVSGHFLETSNYNGKLLKSFNEALQDGGKQKIIFVHLMGSHAPFDQRYPKEFNTFTN